MDARTDLILTELRQLKAGENDFFTRDEFDEYIKKNEEFQNVQADARLLELDALDLSLTPEKYLPPRLKAFQEALLINEEKFNKIKQVIIKHFLKSKKLARVILKKLDEVNNNIAIANAQNALIKQNFNNIDILKESCALLQACPVVASKKLSEAKNDLQIIIAEYGNARIWQKFKKKIDVLSKDISSLFNLANQQKVRLEALQAQKDFVNEPVHSLELLELPVQELKKDLIQKVPEEDKEAVEKHYTRTVNYAQVLSNDMRKSLKKFKNTQYWINLGLPESVDFALSKLKEFYDVNKDSNPEALNVRATLSKSLQEAKHEPLKDALEKYHFVTKLLRALDNPTVLKNYTHRKQTFFAELRAPENQPLILKHRKNNAFVNFIRECGASVSSFCYSIMGKKSNNITFFSPRSARYSKAIELEEVEISKRHGH